MNPPPEYWGRLVALLATEASLLVAFAALVARRLPAPRHRRLTWLTALLAIASLWSAELLGARDLFARWNPATAAARWVEIRRSSPAESTPATRRQTPEPDSLEANTGTRRGTWWPGALWAAGTGACLMAQGTAFALLILRHRRGLRPSPAVLETARKLAARLGVGDVEVRVWPGLSGPIAFGLRRPCVAIPERLEARFTPLQCEAILAHELAHHAARDPLRLTIANFISAFAWWHPLVWWARRRLQAEMEAAADLGSTLVPDGPLALAESLVVLGRELAVSRTCRGLGIAGAGPRSDLATRVRHLLARPDPWQLVSRKALALGTVGALAVCGLVLAAPLPGDALPPLGRLLLAPVAKAQPATSVVLTAASENAPGKPAPPSGTPPRRNIADALESAAPPIQFRIRFYEVTERDGRGRSRPAVPGFDSLFANFPPDDAPPLSGPPTGDMPGAASAHRENFRTEQQEIRDQRVVLPTAEAMDVLRRLASRPGVTLVAAPGIATLSGRPAKVQINQALNVVAGVIVPHGDGTKAGKVSYQTESWEFGPGVEIIPEYLGNVWHLRVDASFSQFLGYDDPGTFIPAVATEAGSGPITPLQAVLPLPRIRVRRSLAEAHVTPDQTLILRGPVAEESVTIPAKWYRPARTEKQLRRLYIAVTPENPRSP